MSVISVSCGSCGVALSTAMFESIFQSVKNISNSTKCNNRSYAESIRDIYFKTNEADKFISRSILIGSETSNFNDYKLTQRLLKSKGTNNSNSYDWEQDQDLIAEFQESSNNCWAHGFFQSQQQEEFIRDLLCTETEQADTLDSFLIYSGLAGGTGSGGCSLVSQILADDYSSTCQTCISVLPFNTGENAMQSINSMLALSTIYETTNGVVLFENDRYDSICKNVFKDRSFGAINDCIANSLFSNIQPIANTCSISRKTIYRNNIEQMLRELCPYPKHKILTSRALSVDSRNNLSYENPTHSKLLSQIVESINECLLPFETIETNDVDVDVHYSTFTPTSIQQGNVSKLDQNNIRGKKKNELYNEQEEKYLYKNVVDIPIIAPSYLSVKNGILVNKKKQCLDSTNNSFIANLKNSAKKKVTLINTGGIRKKPIKKNIVTSMNINIGGILDDEGIDFNQHLSQVLFWGHSISPARACYSPWDGGVDSKSCGILSNCQTPLKSISRANNSFKMSFASNAYLNKYQSFGMDNDEFTEAIIRGEQIINSYNI